METPVTWKELVADALTQLGGEASLKDISATLKHSPLRPQTATWNATIRRVVRQYKIFEPVKMRGGLAGYRLVEADQPEPKTDNASKDPHGEQQGMLLKLGMLCGYETFTNSTDKTIRRFGGEPISKFATIRNDADSLSALPIKKMRNTDVMWMADDSEGLYPRYVFEVENSTGVKSGLIRLLQIPERFNAMLFVVGPSDEEAKLFDRYMRETPFRQHADRIQFHFYDEVRKFYESGTTFDSHRKSWSIQFATK
jgi:hypothetical protein